MYRNNLADWSAGEGFPLTYVNSTTVPMAVVSIIAYFLIRKTTKLEKFPAAFIGGAIGVGGVISYQLRNMFN